MLWVRVGPGSRDMNHFGLPQRLLNEGPFRVSGLGFRVQ